MCIMTHNNEVTAITPTSITNKANNSSMFENDSVNQTDLKLKLT